MDGGTAKYRVCVGLGNCTAKYRVCVGLGNCRAGLRSMPWPCGPFGFLLPNPLERLGGVRQSLGRSALLRPAQRAP